MNRILMEFLLFHFLLKYYRDLVSDEVDLILIIFLKLHHNRVSKVVPILFITISQCSFYLQI